MTTSQQFQTGEKKRHNKRVFAMVSPEDCPKYHCKNSNANFACCYLDRLHNRKLWCLRDDVPIPSGHVGPTRSDICLAERPRVPRPGRK